VPADIASRRFKVTAASSWRRQPAVRLKPAKQSTRGSCSESFGSKFKKPRIFWLGFRLEANHKSYGSQEIQRSRTNPAGLKVSFSFFGLADLLDDLGQDDEAWDVYRQLLSSAEADPDHLVAAVSFAVRRGDAAVNEMLKPPGDEGVRKNLATALNAVACELIKSAGAGSRSDKVQALKLATAACEFTNYSNPEMLKILAGSYAASGQFDKAVTLQRKAIELAPEDQKEAYQSLLNLYRNREG